MLAPTLQSRSSGFHSHRMPHRFAHTALWLALATGLAAVETPAHATTITTIGDRGGIGAPGANGGGGGGAKATFTSSEFFNTAAARAGDGGRGGRAVRPFAFGGDGGKGGKATAAITSGNQPYEPPDRNVGSSTARASGGDGGVGGGVLLRGDGGRGGDARATVVDTGSSGPDVIDAVPGFSGRSAAVAGNGGAGWVGGHGGKGEASTAVDNEINGGSSSLASATGGNGGGAVLAAGNGGIANARSNLIARGFPSENLSRAVAHGGNGGSSSNGLNGGGGKARATASGIYSGRDLGMIVEATATGGNGGTGVRRGVLQGRGGNAIASADGLSSVQGLTAISNATGGNGVTRGGYAVANAQNTSDMFGSSTATANGGAGKQAGTALATAVTTSGFLFATSDAGATSKDPLARSVRASAQSFTSDGVGERVVYAQAQAGNTDYLLAMAPTVAAPAVLARGAIAPSANTVAQTLAGNPQVRAKFAEGSLLGLGEFGAEATAENRASISYVFDVDDYDDPQHLWLGLLDADAHVDDAATGDFRFIVSGEGKTLFERSFTGSDFLDVFDDRLFDLGSWVDRVGRDGLFNLDVSFAGFVPDIRFAFADAPMAVDTAVPEPAAIWLLLPGLIGWWWRPRAN